MEIYKQPKKTGQSSKQSLTQSPPPLFRAMPKRKQNFAIDGVPKKLKVLYIDLVCARVVRMIIHFEVCTDLFLEDTSGLRSCLTGGKSIL